MATVVGPCTLAIPSGEGPDGAVFDHAVAPIHHGPRAVRVVTYGRVAVLEGVAAVHAAPVRRGGAVRLSSGASVAIAHAVAFDIMCIPLFRISRVGAATSREPGSRAEGSH